MINNFINKYFFYLYAFTLCFGVLFYNTTGFKGLDVVSGLLLVVLYIIYVIGSKNKSFNIGFLAVILVFLFFLNYSFYIANNSLNAIGLDFLIQLRPYVAFFLVLQMSPTFTEVQKKVLRKICFFIWLFYIPIGLLATVNPSFLSTMMDQPANYTACITCLAMVHLYCSDFTFKHKLTFIFMLAAGLITFHSRFYIFFLVVCGLLMFFHHIDVLRSNLKTGLALTSVAGLVIYFSRAEIFNYLFPVGMTGDGFASFTAQTSAGFFSQLNNNNFNPINGFMNQEWFTGSSSYYPFLAQLGLIGIFLYLSFWMYIITISIIQFKRKGDIQPFIIVLLLAVFVFLENISDAFFTSNKGYFVMMFIGLLMSKPEETDSMVLFPDKATNKKKRSAALQAFWLIRKKRVSHTDNKQITYLIPPVPTTNNVTADEIRSAEIDINHGNTTDHQKYMPAIQNEDEVEVEAISTPPSVDKDEMLAVDISNIAERYEDTVAVVNDMQNESCNAIAASNIPAVNEEAIDETRHNLGTEIQLTEDIIPASEMLYMEADDEFDWEDDFEDDDEDDWEAVDDNNIVKEIVCQENDSKVEIKEEVKEENIEAKNVSPSQIEVINISKIEEEKVALLSVPLQSYTINTYTPSMTCTFNQPEEVMPKKATIITEVNSDDELPEESYIYMI